LVAAEDADPEHAERLILSPYNSKFAKTKKDKKTQTYNKKMPCRQCSVPGGTERESAPRETCSTTNTYQCFRIITRAAAIVTLPLQQGKTHEQTLTTKNTRIQRKQKE